MAEIRALHIHQGDDVAWVLPVTSGGSAADLTGYTPAAQIRRSASDSTAIDLTIDSADLAAGNIGLSLTAAVTAGMSGEYVWDCEVVDGSGGITTVTKGPVTVTDEVTRA